MEGNNSNNPVNKNETQDKPKTLRLVVTQKGYCKYGHPVTQVNKEIQLETHTGTRTQSIRTNYCRVCKCHYINASTGSYLKKAGKPLCTIEGDTTIQRRTNDEYHIPEYENRGGNLEARSVLNKLGYNVNQNDDLSDNERQCILIEAIENRNISKRRLISFLEWLVEENCSYRKMDLAVAKWKRDIEFVKNYTPKRG